MANKADLDAARASAQALTAALRDAEAAAAALNKRGPMTPQQAAAAEVKRLAGEAREAAAAYDALAKAQAKALNSFSAGAPGATVSPWAAKPGAAPGRAPSAGGAAQAAAAKKAAGEGVPQGKLDVSGIDMPKWARYLLKQAGVSKAAMRAPVVAAALDLTKLAMGQRGIMMLQALEQRAMAQGRQLFRGVDSSPVTRAADRFLQMLNPMSATGKALSSIFSNVFNGLFGSIEKIEPLARAFAKGLVIGALNVETAWYELRIAMLPVTNAIEDALGPIDGISVAATAGGVALGAMAIYAGATVAPFVAGAAAVGLLTKQILDLKSAWDSANPGKIAEAASKIGGFGAAQAGAFGQQAGGAIRERLGFAPAGVEPPANDVNMGKAGATSGMAYVNAVAAVVSAGAGAVGKAGEALGASLDQGTRGALKIKSPSKVGEETGGQYPAGLARGVDAGAGDVATAAARAMAPMVGAKGAGQPPSSQASVSSLDLAALLVVLRQIEANTRDGGANGTGVPGGDPMRMLALSMGVDVRAA